MNEDRWGGVIDALSWLLWIIVVILIVWILLNLSLIDRWLKGLFT